VTTTKKMNTKQEMTNIEVIEAFWVQYEEKQAIKRMVQRAREDAAYRMRRFVLADIRKRGARM
jgi:hypothetical protein